MAARVIPVVFGLVLLAIAIGACSDQNATPSTDTGDGTPASELAVAADQEMRAVPDGYVDCGSVSLRSGWPTTTVFNTEMQGECITQAAASGEPSQQAFSGRNNEGGIVGSIVRVNGPDDLAVIDYHIDPAGSVTSSETTCTGLDTSGIGPPTCLGT